MASTANIPATRNEPVLSYAPGTPERAAVKTALKTMSSEVVEIPVIIGGEEIRTGTTNTVVAPHRHAHKLALVHLAGPREISRAIQVADRARREWESWRFEERAAVFLR